MVETLIVSGKPGLTSLRNVWLCIVAQAIALWGFIVSILLPIVKEQPGMPLEVETYASRYRLMTPEPSAEGKYNRRSILFLKYPAQKMHRTPSFDSLDNNLDHDSSDMPWNYSGFAAPSVLRSCSTSACCNFGTIRARKVGSAARPRSNSDPTNTKSKAAIRARRCMSIANTVATNAAMPARPLIRRARSVLQRSISTKEAAADFDEDDEDGESGPGMGLRTKTAIIDAGVRTKNAFNRSATVATSALLTASHKITPGGTKGATHVIAVAEVECEEETVSCYTDQKLDDPVIEACPQKPLQARSKTFSRKTTMFTKSRFSLRRRN